MDSVTDKEVGGQSTGGQEGTQEHFLCKQTLLLLDGRFGSSILCQETSEHSHVERGGHHKDNEETLMEYCR
jgi:hypothetical protein